jgi:hypothetical protein
MNIEQGALVLLALAEVVQVMSGFLPSPTTAYMGGADPRRIKSLRFDEVLGASVALSIALAVAILIKNKWVVVGSALVLTIFLVRFEYQLRKAESEAASGVEPTKPGWY